MPRQQRPRPGALFWTVNSWWEQLPVLSNNSIEKFAVEMEETLKCEMYQREKAEQKALCKENEMSRKSV